MENTDTQKNNVEENVLEKIKNGEVKMRSKYYFICKVAILALFTFSIFLLTVILVSYFIFSVKTDGYVFLLGFGTKGIYKFLMILPWFILALNAALLIFLDYLLRRFSFGYNRPVLYLFLGSLVLVTLLSYLVNFTSFHSSIMTRAQTGKLPIGNSFYKEMGSSYKSKGVLKGEVVAIGQNYIVVRHKSSQSGGSSEEKIIFPKSFSLPGFINIGDEVFLALDVASGTEITAYGVHRIER